VPDHEGGFAGGILVPAGTPKDVVNLLHREIARIVSAPDVKDRLAALGFDPVANTPEEFAAWIKAETAKWGKVVRATNMKID
jgi:tripartite-type tricarboxylate transporter receptor subunit TctC